MQLAYARWPDIQAYAASSRGVIVPIGSTEQHGPNGVIGTDALCADAIARAVADRCEALVTPPIAIGMAVYHMGFPGSLTLRPSTLIALVCDVTASLARHGLTRIFFLNGHGGNTAVLQAAFCEAYFAAEQIGSGRPEQDGETQSWLRCQVHKWWQGDTTAAFSNVTFGADDGVHATASEISVVQHVYGTRPVDPLEPRVAPGGVFYGAADFRSRFPDGRVGSDPSLATAEHGSEIFETAVSDACAAYTCFVAD